MLVLQRICVLTSLLITPFLTAGTTALFTLDDATGATSATESIAANNATVNGTVTFQQNGAHATTGTSAAFDGSSWLEVPYTATLNPTGSFSIDFWAKVNGGTNTYRTIISSRAADKTGFIVRVESNNSWRFYVGDGDWHYVDGPDVILNKWTHVLATFEATSESNGVYTGKIVLYIDGIREVTKTVSYKPNTSAVRPLRIGGGGDTDAGNTPFFKLDGSIDHVRISSGVQTPLTLPTFDTAGFVTRKRFWNIPTRKLSVMTDLPNYPVDPNAEEVITSMQAPAGIGNNFGAVIEAYYTPTVTGNYVFKFVSDNAGELSISTDKNPINLSKICSVASYVSQTAWNSSPSQTSDPIALIAGQTYLLRGIYKEEDGGDHFNVNIIIDGGTQQAIDSAHLKPVLYDHPTNKALLGQSITAANSLLTTVQANTGTTVGTYSAAAVANFQEEIAIAQAVDNNVNATGRELYAACWELYEKYQAIQPLAPTKLYGEAFGSTESRFTGTEIDKAFDGDTGTYVYTMLNPGIAGIELAEKLADGVISKLRFYPNGNWESRVVGSKFQGSIDGQTWTDLHTINTTPSAGWNEVDLSSNTTAYRYFRIYDSNDNVNMKEIEFYAFYTPELRLALNKTQPFVHATADQPITSSHLLAEHHVLYHHNITYTLTAIPQHGTLKLNGTALTVNDTFTQQDIDDNLLTFTDDQTHTDDSFSFTVADSLGNTLPAATFSLMMDSDFDGLSDSTEIAGNTDWNNADTDGDGETDKWEIDNGTDPTVDDLSPAVTALQGENGISAAYWNSAPGSLANFSTDKGPVLVKKLSTLNYTNRYTHDAGGSNNRFYVVGKYETYLWVPKAGSYTFDLLSDDGSKLVIEGVEVINNDGVHGTTKKTYTHNFATAGFKKLKLEYFQGWGYHSLMLYWQGPGISRKIIPANYLFVSIPEHQAIVDSVDTDQDYLTDILETQEGTDPLNPDTDGDKLLDGEEYHSTYGYKTDPTLVDTDSDTVNDWDEIFLFLSNPLVADFNGNSTVAQSIAPNDYYVTHGSWEQVGTDDMRHTSRTAAITWKPEIQSEGIYLLELDVTQHIENSAFNDFSIVLHIDSMLVGRRNFTATYGQTETVKFLTPNLSVNDHLIELFIDNGYRNTSLVIQDVRLTIPGSAGTGTANWQENHINTIAGLITTATSSKTSPVCIEGKGRYLGLMDFANDNSALHRSGWNKWYTNIPLLQNQAKTFEVSYQKGFKTETLNITWDETNILDGGTMSIRKGDSLLLNIISGHENSGVVSASVTVDGQTYTVDPSTPKEYLFDTVGTYTITATQEAGNGTISNGSMDIKVIEAPATNPLHVWRFRDRTITWPAMDSELVLDGDGLTLTDNGDGTHAIKRNEALEEVSILTRLGTGGPIVSHTPTQPFWLYELIEGYNFDITQLPSGDYRVADTVLLSPYAADDIEVTVEIFVSGVTFEDGSTTKVLKKEDFTVLGEYELVMLKDATRLGVTCHRIKVYQNGEFVGQRN